MMNDAVNKVYALLIAEGVGRILPTCPLDHQLGRQNFFIFGKEYNPGDT